MSEISIMFKHMYMANLDQKLTQEIKNCVQCKRCNVGTEAKEGSG